MPEVVAGAVEGAGSPSQAAPSAASIAGAVDVAAAVAAAAGAAGAADMPSSGRGEEASADVFVEGGCVPPILRPPYPSAVSAPVLPAAPPLLSAVVLAP